MEQIFPQTAQLRPGLEFSRQQHQGKTYFVVKDPLTTRYFRFTETQGVILDLLGEPTTAAAVAELASEKLRGALSAEAVEGFLKSLEQKLLLDTPRVREELADIKSRRPEGHSPLYWKLASVNPEKIFEWLLPRTGWVFTAGFQVFAALVIVTGLILNYINIDHLTASVRGMFNLHGLFFLWIVIFSVSTLHEFAHGLTCRHFGGKVRELGLMLIYFNPAMYCDVSDSWMFPEKKHRILVTFAGGYFQMVVWGMATIFWRLTEPDTVINQIALVINVFAGLQTLVNFNPLIKLDGYYMLSDYLEIPNLRRKAFASLWSFIAGPGGKNRSNFSWREERARIIYGIAAFTFSTTLLIYVYSAIYSWVTSRYAFAGLVGFLMFSTLTLRRSALGSLAGLRALASRAAVRKYRNAGIAAAALLVSFAGHWELKIPADFKVIARSERSVRPETGGVIVEMLVREGSKVATGEVLARLQDFDKQQRGSQLSGELARKRSELALLRAGARPEEVDLKQRLVETKRIEVTNARRNQEQRNRLEQELAGKREALKLDQQTAARNRDLFKEGLIPRAELEKAETGVSMREKELGAIEASIRVVTETADREADLKEKELAEAESELRLMQAGNRPEQIRQVEADVTRLERQSAILKEELGKTEIRSPIDGLVATPFVERKLNQHLAAGDELARIVDISRVTIEMQVPEKEMADVRPGHVVWMKARSFPSMDFQGRVDFIAPVAHAVNGQQMVVVRSEIANEDLLLKPDMTGVARIYCGERRIADLMTRRIARWIRTEFFHLLP